MTDDITYRDMLRTGPDTVAGRYLRRFWQPIFRAVDLPRGRATPIKIMSEEFTLYRGESGAPYLVAQRCAQTVVGGRIFSSEASCDHGLLVRAQPGSLRRAIGEDLQHGESEYAGRQSFDHE